MVESFVERYREANAGAFPTAVMTQKQVGGSYYVIRYIFLQLRNSIPLPQSKVDTGRVVEIAGNELSASGNAVALLETKRTSLWRNLKSLVRNVFNAFRSN